MIQESYLLRFWRTPQGEEWRITLIWIGSTPVEQHFVSVDDLSRYLSSAYRPTADLAIAQTHKHTGTSTQDHHEERP